VVSRVNLFIPIELKQREFYSKVLIARYAVERGFRVFLGRKSELNALALRMENGVYHGLSTAQNMTVFYESLARRGYRISVNDEEGLVTFSDAMYLDLKVAPTTLRFIDRLFAWGPENHRVLTRGRPEITDRIHISGNPRFDLLKPEFRGIYDGEVKSIRARHPNFALICTSFGSCNHYIRDLDYVQSLIEKKVLKNPESIAAYRRYQEIKMRAWQEFNKAIPLLARAFPKIHFIIRPHPSENPESYRVFTGKFSNVFSSDEFSIHPWVLAAKVVVHHHCTSSVEAFAAGTPGFALRPDPDPQVEKEIPYECSRQCGSAMELLELLHPAFVSEGEEKLPLLKPTCDYREVVHNIGRPVASEIIAKEVAQLAKTKGLGRAPCVWGTGRAWLKSFLSPLSPRNWTNQRYLSHKTATITVAEVRQAIGIFVPNLVTRFRYARAGPRIVSIENAN